MILNQKFNKIFLLLFMSLFFLGCKNTNETKLLKLAHSLSTEHPVHQAMIHMDKILLEKSEGKLGLEIYPSQQLGTERQCLELLQIGSLAMTKVSSAVI